MVEWMSESWCLNGREDRTGWIDEWMVEVKLIG